MCNGQFCGHDHCVLCGNSVKEHKANLVRTIPEEKVIGPLCQTCHKGLIKPKIFPDVKAKVK